MGDLQGRTGEGAGGAVAVAVGRPGDGADALVDRILAAAVRCIARWGVAKTTVDDVAREAGCSRATLYRALPGGRDALLLAAAERELALVEASVATDLAAAADLEDLVVVALHRGACAVADHGALQYLLAHEPEHVLPWVAFDGLDPLLAQVSGFLRPWLVAHLPPEAPDGLAEEVGELIARVIVAYAVEGSERLDLTRRRDAAHLVGTYVLPGIHLALANAGVDHPRPRAAATR